MAAKPQSLGRTLWRALTRHTTKPLDSAIDAYRPLLGGWLLQMALQLRWTRPGPRGELPDVFADEDFIALTSLVIEPEEEYVDDDDPFEPIIALQRGKRWKEAELVRRVKARLKELRASEWSPDLPLLNNIEMLTHLVGGGVADQAVLLFAAALSIFPRFRLAVLPTASKASNQELAQMIAGLTGQPAAAVHAALSPNAPLVVSGILLVNEGILDLEDKLSLMNSIDGLLMTPGVTKEAIADRFLKRATPAQLATSAFPHLRRDVEALGAYLGRAARTGTPGVNVLFYGLPGTGKTEMVKALAAEVGLELYEINFADADGDPIHGEKRLRAYNLCQKLLTRRDNALLLFDEIEDVFAPAEPSWLFSELDIALSETAGGGGKAWINRTLERNPVPAIWVTNHHQLDPAYLRRFGYSVNFPIPPRAVREEIARHHFKTFEPDEAWLARIAAAEHLLPGQLERAAAFARIASPDDPARALELAVQNLERGSALLGHATLPARNRIYTGYALDYLNTDLDVDRLIAGLKRNPTGTFCFYGPAGTGKSELARHIADAIGCPLLVKRASDLLSKWVGDAEKNIAEMFAAAREQGAVLVLDEADSFLGERSGARNSWEVTQVNEFLTQIEAHDGLFIATTNLMDRLDQASLRRFVGKVRFDYLKPAQRLALFRQELARLGGDPAEAAAWEAEVQRLDRLTPGDFAVAARQFALWHEAATAEALVEVLRKECAAKAGAGRPIGFVN